jgi:hypothetical protein
MPAVLGFERQVVDFNPRISSPSSSDSGVNNIYLLDTNILIYYFNDDPAVQPIFEAIQVGDAVGFYCPIS